MRYSMVVNCTTLVAHVVGDFIENFVLVDGDPVFGNNDKNMGGLTVDEYKKSPSRGLFYYVSYADVLTCNARLRQRLNITSM